MSVTTRPRGVPLARLGARPFSTTFVATTDGGFPWQDGELLYADDLNAAVTSTAVSVLDFGAKGDGVTDDTAAIQCALNDFAGKAAVLVPDTGLPYMVTNLQLPSKTDLVLYGMIKLLPNSPKEVVGAFSKSQITIRGYGVIDGNATAQATHPGGMAGLAISESSNVRVSGITLQNAYHWNMNTTASSDVVVNGVTFRDDPGTANSANEFAAECTDCWLTNCIIDGTNNGDYGFAFYGGVTNSGAIGNVVKNCGANLTAFTPPGIGILSDGAAGTPTAIQCRNITIANNIIHNCAGPGISCDNVSGGLQSGIVIANNRSYQNSQIAGGGIGGSDFFIDHSTDVTITGNQSSANGGSGATQYTGIFLGPNASNVSVIGNHIYNTGAGSGTMQSAGVWGFGGPNIYIADNWIYDDQTSPTMQYSMIGGFGTNSAAVGNFFDRPFNAGPDTDTVLANVINGTWMIGGTTGAEVKSVIQVSNGQRGALQYQTSYVPRWYAGTDATSAANYVITRVADGGTEHPAITVRRADAVVNVNSPAVAISSDTSADVTFAVNPITTGNGVLRYYNAGNTRWDILVTPASDGSNLQFISWSDVGTEFSPLTIARATGRLIISVPPSFANDAAAATGGIPVGGIYRNGSILMIRVS